MSSPFYNALLKYEPRRKNNLKKVFKDKDQNEQKVKNTG